MKKLTNWQKEKKEFEKKRKIVIKELEKIEKKFGDECFRSAINRKLTVDRQKRKRIAEINKAEKELKQLKKGKPVSDY